MYIVEKLITLTKSLLNKPKQLSTESRLSSVEISCKSKSLSKQKGRKKQSLPPHSSLKSNLVPLHKSSSPVASKQAQHHRSSVLHSSPSTTSLDVESIKIQRNVSSLNGISIPRC